VSDDRIISKCGVVGWLIENYQGEPKYQEKTLTSATVSTTNPTYDLGWNPGHCCEKLATNGVSYGMAPYIYKYVVYMNVCTCTYRGCAYSQFNYNCVRFNILKVEFAGLKKLF
jgi:hypothetical protein